jgi:pilus assembly protein Flp/PilA
LNLRVFYPDLEEWIMRSLINRFRRDDEGAALVEYGMLVGLIAVICVVAVTALGTEVSTAFSTIASALSGI